LLYFALHVLFVSHETFCFYQTVYIFIYSAYKLQVCSLNFCSSAQYHVETCGSPFHCTRIFYCHTIFHHDMLGWGFTASFHRVSDCSD